MRVIEGQKGGEMLYLHNCRSWAQDPNSQKQPPCRSLVPTQCKRTGTPFAKAVWSPYQSGAGIRNCTKPLLSIEVDNHDYKKIKYLINYM
jgi:hypothetical protein